MNAIKSRVKLVFKGMAMGIAEIIPGVSGGTIAFITGIYKELIDAIKSFNVSAILLLLKGHWKEFGKRINLSFLIFLMAGMSLGLIIGVFGVSHLLESNPEVLWGFFFGLIVASVPMMLSSLKQIKMSTILVFLVGALVAFFITSLSPVETNTELYYIFLSGMLAIFALVLPGVSGSFILLLLGMYTFIIPTLKSFLSHPNSSDFLILAVFGLGCLTGLLFFVRLVSKAFEKHYDFTVALMSGFMLGSLNKIWPWRNIQSYMVKETGEVMTKNNLGADLIKDDIKILTEQNVFPSEYSNDPNTFLVIAAILLGIVLIAILHKMNHRSLKE